MADLKPQCTFCGTDAARVYTRRNDYTLYRCAKCHLIYVWPLPENPSGLYSPDYFHGATGGFGYTDYDSDKEPMFSAFAKYLDKAETYLPQKGKLLDIGAATGFFLQIARDRGWDSYGVEISDYAAEKGRRKGLRIVAGTVEQAEFAPASFDVVTLWDVLEHLPDPKASLRMAWCLLRARGLLALNSPDAESLCARIMGKRWHALVPPEHLHIGSSQSLSPVLQDMGFEIVWTGRIGKRFTIQYIVKTLGLWTGSRILQRTSSWLQGRWAGRLAVPLDLKDNFCLIARKKL